jgi:uncharacterized protein (DUF1800 family)
MPNKEDLALMAHLMRRAGFGATHEELGALAAQGYDAVVDDLVDPPEDRHGGKKELLLRYHPGCLLPGGNPTMGQANWLYRMISTDKPLEEKIALFWHHVFATGNAKLDNCDMLLTQIDMLREHGMGNYRELLVRLAKDPAMIYWLDNNENHRDAVNENWGRELLELFTMGVSNYTEVDVREASRAFTGWTIQPKLPRQPYGRYPWKFIHRDEDHDFTEKTFLGETGNFDGEDIINIVVDQPATARFICRHLYNFFVADEPQVPAWTIEPARDEDALDQMIAVFEESNYNIREVLRMTLKSDFFKNARYSKIKSPAEVVANTLKMTGAFQFPDPGMGKVCKEPGYMGQDILDPPSVEGWHTGSEWINSGSLLARINFVADSVTNTELPGIQSIVHHMKAEGVSTPDQLLDSCLDHMGFLVLNDETRAQLSEHGQSGGNLNWSDEASAATRIGEMMALICATTEYQFA